MAITGRFVADFSDFDAACKQAEVELKGLETGSERVEKSLNRMVDQFSGRKLIQDANLMVEAIERLGGASQLTERELTQAGNKAKEAADKMRALGMDVPKGLDTLATSATKAGAAASTTATYFRDLGNQVAGMLTAGAIVSFGKQVLDTADNIQTLAQRTGLTTDEIERLMAVARDSGTGIETFSGAIQTMQERIGRGNAGTLGALKDLGFNLTELKAQTHYDQLMSVASALGAIEDPAKQAAQGGKIFGDNWKDMLPAVKKGMDDVAASAIIMGREAVKAGADTKQSLGEAANVATVALARIVAGVRDAGYWLGRMVDTYIDPSKAPWAEQEAIRANDFGGALIHTVAPGFKAVTEAMAFQTHTAEELAEAEFKLKLENEKSIADNKAREEATKKMTAADKAALKELNALADLHAEAARALSPLTDRTAEYDEAMIQLVGTLREAGFSVEQLTKLYGGQATAYAEMADIYERRKKAAAELAALETEYNALVIAQSGTRADAEIADINRQAAHHRATLEAEQILTTENAKMIEALRVAQINRVMGLEVELTDKTRAAAEQRAVIERNRLNAMMADWNQWGEAAIREQERVAIEAEESARDFDLSWTGALEDTKNKHRAAAQSVAMTWSQAMDAVRAGQGTMSGTLPQGPMADRATIQKAFAAGRYFGPVLSRNGQAYAVDWAALGMSQWEGGLAAGGPVQAGSAYTVGEQGPELFVPSRSGDIIPNGAGGMAMQNVFNINGTGADIARVVVSELTRLMRVGRKWPAV